eukprot:GHRQ01019169.1.p1 GENE.GHRQ01019169.1~~GHRQ01019169.1.p1  ORF type:complete len:279 (+),score=83.79 GHRQ01019169.1:1190-2026(+)
MLGGPRNRGARTPVRDQQRSRPICASLLCCNLYSTQLAVDAVTILHAAVDLSRHVVDHMDANLPCHCCLLLHCMLQRGVLRGFESTQVTLSFAPARQQVYNARAALLLLPPDVEAATGAGSSPAGKPSMLSITAANVQSVYQEDAIAEQRANDGTAAVAAEPLEESGEKLILTIVGEATEGALRIEPSNVSFGAVHVGTPQSRTLSLINQSNGVLRYSIQLVDEAPEGVDRSAAACEFGAATAAALASSCDGADCAGASTEQLEDCWVDDAEGIVNAR